MDGRHEIIRPMCICIFFPFLFPVNQIGHLLKNRGLSLRDNRTILCQAFFQHSFIPQIPNLYLSPNSFHIASILFPWRQTNLYRIGKPRAEISDETHFKNKFMSLWKLSERLKYLWIEKPWRDYSIDDENESYGEQKEWGRKSFSSRFCYFFLSARILCGRAAEHWGRAEDKWNGDLWKIIDDNGIIYDSAMDWTKDVEAFIIQRAGDRSGGWLRSVIVVLLWNFT